MAQQNINPKRYTFGNYLSMFIADPNKKNSDQEGGFIFGDYTGMTQNRWEGAGLCLTLGEGGKILTGKNSRERNSAQNLVQKYLRLVSFHPKCFTQQRFSCQNFPHAEVWPSQFFFCSVGVSNG